MNIDEKLISRLEHLAKLNLTSEERRTLQTELEQILQMVDKLEELDTEGVAPLVYVLEESQLLRPDDVEGQVSQSEALKNAPDTDGTYFKVPKIIDL